jgi:hypothetical protein
MKSLFPLIVLIAATVTAARAEEPMGFLHCIGQTADHKSAEHTLAIYSKTATVDGLKYSLYSDDAHYALQTEDPVAKLVGAGVWITLVAINRVTGVYEISGGRTLGEQVKNETGTCTKMDRKL